MNIRSGFFVAILFYVLLEILVIIIEAGIYALAFKERGVLRAISYAIIANLVSFMTGYILFVMIYSN